MNQEKYTERMRSFLQSSHMLALPDGHQRLVPAHLLKLLLAEPAALAATLTPPPGAVSPAAPARALLARSRDILVS